MILGASVSVGAKVFLIVRYDVIYVLPLIAIVVVCGVMGPRGVQLVGPVGDWIAAR
jgi:hypothetical protein